MRTLLATVAAGLLLTGCSALGGALSPAPVQSSTAQPGQVEAGSVDCLLATKDGDYTVFVMIGNTANCDQWTQALAHDGSYWVLVVAGGPSGTQDCSVADAGMTLKVWQYSSIDEPIGGSVAQGVCTSMEQNGWTPAQ